LESKLEENIENFSIGYLIKILLNNLTRILALGLIFASIFFGLSFFFEKKYLSEATIIEVVDSSSSLSASSLFGIDLGRSNNSAKAIAVMQSRDFIYYFLTKYNLLSLIEKNEDIDISNINENKKEIVFSPELKVLSKIPGIVGKFNKEILTIDQADVDGIIILSISTKKPEYSQKILDLFIKEIDKIMKLDFISQTKANINALKNLTTEVKDPLSLNIISELHNEEQKNLIKAETSEFFSFKLLDSPYLPINHYFPNRLLFIIFGFILGIIIGYLYFFRKKIAFN
tara:strand:- start:2538 stop:3395 length:858 start_codon:yes stop_codon:yes gene_type:complete